MNGILETIFATLILNTVSFVGTSITTVGGYFHEEKMSQIQAKQYFCNQQITCKPYFEFAVGKKEAKTFVDKLPPTVIPIPLGQPSPVQPIPNGSPSINVPIPNQERGNDRPLSL